MSTMSLVLVSLACLFCLYGTGYVWFRALRVAPAKALAAAPLGTVGLYAIQGIINHYLGIPSTWWSTLLPAFLLGVCALALSRYRAKHGASVSALFARSEPLAWKTLGLYVLVSVLIAGWMFGSNIPSSESIAQMIDNVFHLGGIRTLLETSNWSSLGISVYTPEEKLWAPTADTTFYPAAWHCLVALVITMTGASVPLAANAVCFWTVAAVYPGCVWLLAQRLFKDTPQALWAGAVIVPIASSFPLGFMVYGPIFPNLLAFSLVPGVVLALWGFLEGDSDPRVHPHRTWGLILVLGAVSLALAQPGAVFTTALFGLPLVLCCAWRWGVQRGGHKNGWLLGLAVVCGLIALFAVLWGVLYQLPFMEAVVGYTWPVCGSFWDGVVTIVTGQYRFVYGEPYLAALTLVGLVFFLRDKQKRWVAIAWLLMCVPYLVAYCLEGPIRHLLSGFWYGDTFRLAAMICMVGVYPAAYCLGRIITALQGLLENRQKAAVMKPLVGGVILIAFCLLTTVGTSSQVPAPHKGAMDHMEGSVKHTYGAFGETPLNPDELTFLEQVKDVVPEGSRIINIPDDGSAFTYGSHDMPLVYRTVGGFSGERETEASRIVRNELRDYAFVERVAQAVEQLGADYVLQLDRGPGEDSNYSRIYIPHAVGWEGIATIDENTPGFELVLSDGPMKLYKILPRE